MRPCVRLLMLLSVLCAATAHAGLPIPPQLQIYGPAPLFDFGNVAIGDSRMRTIGLTAPASNGGASVQITSIVQGSGSDFAVSGTCPSGIINATGSCNLEETFTPTASGLRTGSVTVTCQVIALPLVGVASFACNGVPYTISLVGVGGLVAAVPALQPTLVAVLAAGLLLLSMLFVSRRHRARDRER